MNKAVEEEVEEELGVSKRERESVLNEWVRECTSTYVVKMGERVRERATVLCCCRFQK